MSRSLEQNPGVEEFAQAAGLSRSQLHRVFKAHLRETPLSYFRRLKISHAATMLRSSPHRSIGDIARQLSFESQTYFAYLFRREMGVSPGDYRKPRNTP